MNELKKSEVLFDEISHTYTLNGKKLHGITPIISWLFPNTYKNISNEVLQSAAEYGSRVHKACEFFDTCGFGDEMQEVKDYARLKQENNLISVANEYLVDDGKDIASSIDVVFNNGSNTYHLADIKTTSEIHVNNVTLQLSIYAYLFERCNKGKRVGKLYVIWLPKEQYGVAKLMRLNRISATDCKRIISAYLKGEDPAILRKEIFNIEEQKNEITQIEEQLPIALKDVENEILKLEESIKELEDKRKTLKEGLLSLMERNNVKKWQGEKISLTRRLESIRFSLDTDKLKTEFEKVYNKCLKKTLSKSSLTINII